MKLNNVFPRAQSVSRCVHRSFRRQVPRLTRVLPSRGTMCAAVLTRRPSSGWMFGQEFPVSGNAPKPRAGTVAERFLRLHHLELYDGLPNAYKNLGGKRKVN